MKNKPYKANSIRPAEILFAALLFACSPSVPADAATPKPQPIAVAQSGRYDAAIQRMKSALQKGNLFDFYVDAAAFLQEWEMRHFSEKMWPQSAEEATAWRQFLPLVATAPLMPDEVFMEKSSSMPSVNKKERWTDVRVKTCVAQLLLQTTLDDTASRERVFLVYRKQTGFSENPETYLTEAVRRERLECLAKMLVGFRAAVKTANKERENLVYPKPIPLNNPPPYPVIQPGEDRDSVAQKMEAHSREIRRLRSNPASGKISLLRERKSEIEKELNIRHFDHKFLQKLLKVFPRDAVSIHEFLQKGGWERGEERAILLERMYPRMRETEWLFKGLSDKEATENYRKKQAQTLSEKKNGIAEMQRKQWREKAQARRRLQLVTNEILIAGWKKEMEAEATLEKKNSKQARINRYIAENESISRELENEKKTDSPSVRREKLGREIEVFSERISRLQEDMKMTHGSLHEKQAKSLQYLLSTKENIEKELSEVEARTSHGSISAGRMP